MKISHKNLNWKLCYVMLCELKFVICHFLLISLAVNHNWLHYSIILAKHDPTSLCINETHSRLILSLMHLLSSHDWTSHEYCNTGPEKTGVSLTCWIIIHGSEHFSTSAKFRTLPSMLQLIGSQQSHGDYKSLDEHGSRSKYVIPRPPIAIFVFDCPT